MGGLNDINNIGYNMSHMTDTTHPKTHHTVEKEEISFKEKDFEMILGEIPISHTIESKPNNQNQNFAPSITNCGNIGIKNENCQNMVNFSSNSLSLDTEIINKTNEITHDKSNSHITPKSQNNATFTISNNMNILKNKDSVINNQNNPKNLILDQNNKHKPLVLTQSNIGMVNYMQAVGVGGWNIELSDYRRG